MNATVERECLSMLQMRLVCESSVIVYHMVNVKFLSFRGISLEEKRGGRVAWNRGCVQDPISMG